MTELTAEEIYRLCEETTHGRDGALLGTEWADFSKGLPQCDWVVDHGDGYQCCALTCGHSGGHRDVYIGNQRAQSAWKRRVERRRGQQKLPPVATLAELLALDTISLRTGDLAWVHDLDGVPPRDPGKPRTKWTGRLVFIERLGAGTEANGDWLIAAPAGGFWARARDVP